MVSVTQAGYGSDGALLLLDLDHFKYVNDTLGHQAGDQVIARVANVLAGRLRESDVLARLGGDEFAALLPRASARTAQRVARDLLAALRAERIAVPGTGGRTITASIGVAMFNAAEDRSDEDVLVSADVAMYDAKEAGRNQVAFYVGGEHAQARMQGRITWAERIRAAIDEQRFTLVAQPIFDLLTNQVTQFEVLLRMRDDHGDLIPPSAFLSTAERLGMIGRIDAMTVAAAIRAVAEHDINLEHADGRPGAMTTARTLIKDAIESVGHDRDGQGIHETKSKRSQQYLFARLEGDVIRKIVQRNEKLGRPIFRIWPDFEIRPLINQTVSTVKADAARVSFSAFGKDIVWAVLDSGIDAGHRHFEQYDNVLRTGPLEPQDFTSEGDPLRDGFGHGTHVAGIIGGELKSSNGAPIHAVTRHRDENGEIVHEMIPVTAMTGMAPQCKLLSLKVLDAHGNGEASNLIAALQYIQELNGHGRRLVVHGVNMSVGYSFEPEWFACGQSPLCVEVEQLVKSGVVVVVAAGNTGFGYNQTEFTGPAAAGLGVTINDPGNADLAITVGSTHRDMPHIYGVSYFSSKGPTGDGRLKPDLVAPGEKILSAAAGSLQEDAGANVAGNPDYVEDSGTSMAAPHVSGVIAAFLSVRREFIGRPDRVKDIFLSTATDLNRDRHFQGRGLVDVMRAIQSI